MLKKICARAAAGLLPIVFFFAVSGVGAQNSWQKSTSPTADTLHNAFFVSEKIGRAISHESGLILHTNDGGKNWTIAARVGAGVLETIYFTDRKNGWIAGERGRVLKTSDGGKSWEKAGDFAETQAFSAVHFFDAKRGFVFGFDTATGRGLIFETSDGGGSWRDRSAEIDEKNTLSDAIFRFDKNSFIVAGKSFLRGRKTKSEKTEFEFTKNETDGTPRGLFFHNDAAGWAVGHRGLLLRTGDGGKTWEKRAAFTGAILRSVYFIDARRGFIAGNRDADGISLWQTNDGGVTWTAAGKDFPNIHRIASNKKNLWLFGAGGAIYSRRLKQ